MLDVLHAQARGDAQAVLAQVGLGDRVDAEGLEHGGIYLQFEGGRHHLDFRDLTGGRWVTIYAQTEIVKDLIQSRLAAGAAISEHDGWRVAAYEQPGAEEDRNHDDDRSRGEFGAVEGKACPVDLGKVAGDGLGDFAEWITLHIERKGRIGWNEFVDIARLGVSQCLASGVTTVGDCSYSGAAAAACAELGLRATYVFRSGQFVTRVVNDVVLGLGWRLIRL